MNKSTASATIVPSDGGARQWQMFSIQNIEIKL